MKRQISVGEIIPLRSAHGRVDDLDAVVPARVEHSLPANDTGADLGNVVPFMRPRGNARTAPAVALPADAQRPGDALARERLRLAALATVSLALHAGLFMAFWREPVPLASIGVEVISVELVIGATAPPGVAPTQGEQQVNAAAAAETEETKVDKVDEKATEQPQTVEVAREETAPEQKPEQPKADEAKPEEPKKFETAAAPQEPAQAERSRRSRWWKAPPDTATPKPQETPPPPPIQVTLPPPPEEKPVDKKAEPKPVQAAPPKPVKDAKPAKEPRLIAARRARRRRARPRPPTDRPQRTTWALALGRGHELSGCRVGASAPPPAVPLGCPQPRRPGHRHRVVQPRRRRARDLRTIGARLRCG